MIPCMGKTRYSKYINPSFFSSILYFMLFFLFSDKWSLILKMKKWSNTYKALRISSGLVHWKYVFNIAEL